MSSQCNKQKKYDRIVLAVFAILFIFIVFFFNECVIADDLTTTSETAGIGNYSLVLPDTVDDVSYDVSLHLVRYYDDGSLIWGSSDEVYYIEIKDSEGNLTSSGNYKFSYSSDNAKYQPELYVALSGVAPGSTITVYNIQIERIEYSSTGELMWTNYSLTQMETYVTCTTTSNKVSLDSAIPATLGVGETFTHTASIEEEAITVSTRTTTDIFETIGGEYDLLYFLSNYNVVSLDEIQSYHIVGPIIAQNTASRTETSPESGEITSVLYASDYSAGISSYVGQLTSLTADSSLSALQLNYGFDIIIDSTFEEPFLYTSETGIWIDEVAQGDEWIDYIGLGEDIKALDAYFLSPNAYGMQETYQNDEFINFEKLESVLIQASEDILTYGDAETTSDTGVFTRYEFNAEDETITIVKGEEKTVYTSSDSEYSNWVSSATNTSGTRLTINAEESWTITNSKDLVEVNIIMPEDYDYYSNPYLFPTTINFSEEYVNPIIVGGVTYSQFPFTLINGAEFTATIGEDGEYSEVSNKIIWNFPNVETTEDGNNKLITVGTSQNIAGHIIAPQAEFWNIGVDSNGNTSWGGGNINGTIIVKSFYSGESEMHMWPYTGAYEEAVVYGVEALKTLDEAVPSGEYVFLLSLIEGDTYEGLLNSNFPMSAASSTSTGYVKFSSLAFEQTGTYSFILQEDTSSDTATDNITYDLSQYQIDITVSSTTSGDTTTYYISEVKEHLIVDSDGNNITDELLDTDTYDSSTGTDIEDTTDMSKIDITFNNTTTEGTVNVTLTKQSTTGHVLSGAKFYVTEMTSSTDTTRPSGGYSTSVTSNTSGVISITDLEHETYYMLQEYEAPSGYQLGEGYWILYINEKGFLEITEMDGAEEITNNIIHNELEETSSLDITLTKKNQMNNTLSGIGFTVERVIVNSYGVPEEVIGGYEEYYTTDENGTFTITGLEADHIYMITEDSDTIPEDHETYTGYWLIEVTGNPLHPSAELSYTITEYDEYHNVVGIITNDTLMNVKIEFVLPETGGIGTTIFYIVGASIMITALILRKKRILKEYKI
ncbi:MAG: SpaA isopeptide-forming pilin-related protein [Eubacteriales bacterium]